MGLGIVGLSDVNLTEGMVEGDESVYSLISQMGTLLKGQILFYGCS